MNNQFFNSTARALAVAALLTLGMSSGSFAMPRDEGTSGPGMHAGHMAHAPKFMQRLHDELKLDAKQEALWQDAEKFAKESHDGKRDQFGKHRAEIDALLDKPGTDLRDIVKRMDEFRADGQKQREAVRDRWLKVYDVLDVTQKEKVRLFFKDEAARAHQAMQRHQHRGHRNSPSSQPDARK